MEKYYLAPMEGITTYIYRNAYHKYFRKMDKYFTPFFVPHSKRGLNVKEQEEILPSNNEGLYIVPQILSNNGEDCVQTIQKIKRYGYEEINLNFSVSANFLLAQQPWICNDSSPDHKTFCLRTTLLYLQNILGCFQLSIIAKWVSAMLLCIPIPRNSYIMFIMIFLYSRMDDQFLQWILIIYRKNVFKFFRIISSKSRFYRYFCFFFLCKYCI